MHVDVLRSPLNNAFAINSEIEGDTLRCGALYLVPQIPDQLIRLAHPSGSVDVELPAELIRRPEPYRAWDINLHIRHEQVRKPPVRS